ncbi:hypothetical protein LTR37_000110 [Vermiconidia calcicola]|uniref:Uncharacterized protein n=1 Tax=Vermiconidia calcicola TaxID=1690605 RepID=A0ACC3P108_9PEZI|nr:hypothetical protein LTR37_000110 [Vermiconidia calcicola]
MGSNKQVATRPLGKNGPQVPRIGLGLMVLSGMYSTPAPTADRLAFLDEAYKQGARFWDTADEYNDSEDLLGKWFAANPEKRQDIFLATKFAITTVFEDNKVVSHGVDSTPEYCRKAIEESLKRLGVDFVDLYYIHRLDKVTPIEKTMEAMVELKNAGKIKRVGMSECSADSLRRAYAVHPITAVQIEYSPFCRDIESPKIKLLETARELGVAVVCYSPLGNGILTGTIRSKEDFSKPGDLRFILPQLKEENLAHNVAVVDRLAEMAEKKKATPAQLVLAWLLSQGDDVFPIPGTTKAHRLQENLGSLTVPVSSEDDKAIRELGDNIKGGRFQEATGHAFADTPPL